MFLSYLLPKDKQISESAMDINYTVKIDMWSPHVKDGIIRMLTEFDEDTVMSLWINGGESRDYENMVYSYDAPLYQKMIWRLRSCKGSAIDFWNQIDPCNRHMMVSRYGLGHLVYGHDQILNFIHWIYNHTGISKEIIPVKLQDHKFVQDTITEYNKYLSTIYRRSVYV